MVRKLHSESHNACLTSTKTELKRYISQRHGNETKPFKEHIHTSQKLFVSKCCVIFAFKTVVGKNQ